MSERNSASSRKSSNSKYKSNYGNWKSNINIKEGSPLASKQARNGKLAILPEIPANLDDLSVSSSVVRFISSATENKKRSIKMMTLSNSNRGVDGLFKGPDYYPWRKGVSDEDSDGMIENKKPEDDDSEQEGSEDDRKANQEEPNLEELKSKDLNCNDIKLPTGLIPNQGLEKLCSPPSGLSRKRPYEDPESAGYAATKTAGNKSKRARSQPAAPGISLKQSANMPKPGPRTQTRKASKRSLGKRSRESPREVQLLARAVIAEGILGEGFRHKVDVLRSAFKNQITLSKARIAILTMGMEKAMLFFHAANDPSAAVLPLEKFTDDDVDYQRNAGRYLFVKMARVHKWLAEVDEAGFSTN